MAPGFWHDATASESTGAHNSLLNGPQWPISFSLRRRRNSVGFFVCLFVFNGLRFRFLKILASLQTDSHCLSRVTMIPKIKYITSAFLNASMENKSKVSIRELICTRTALVRDWWLGQKETCQCFPSAQCLTVGRALQGDAILSSQSRLDEQLRPPPSTIYIYIFARLACRISVPQPGIESKSLQWMPGILTTRPPGNSLASYPFYYIPVPSLLNMEMQVSTSCRNCWNSHVNLGVSDF